MKPAHPHGKRLKEAAEKRAVAENVALLPELLREVRALKKAVANLTREVKK